MTDTQSECLQLFQLLYTYLKQRTATKNKIKHNKACKEVYERIVNKGKSKKLALMVVANKLLKRSFAIAKSGRPYDETYVSILPK